MVWLMDENKCLFAMNGMLKTDICHHGIKGQKWGVRRYQNPDGSLTPEGRKRYLKDGSLTEKGKRKIDVDKYNTFKKNAEERLRKEIETRKREEKRVFKTWDNNKKIVEQDILSNRFHDKNDQVYRKQKEEAADLGLRALKRMGGNDDLRPGNKDDRWWFLYEDQTMGMGTIANMINKGRDVNIVKDLIKAAQYGKGMGEDHYDSSKPENLFYFEVNEGNYNHILESFADACAQIKKEGKNIK